MAQRCCGTAGSRAGAGRLLRPPRVQPAPRREFLHLRASAALCWALTAFAKTWGPQGAEEPARVVCCTPAYLCQRSGTDESHVRVETSCACSLCCGGPAPAVTFRVCPTIVRCRTGCGGRGNGGPAMGTHSAAGPGAGRDFDHEASRPSGTRAGKPRKALHGGCLKLWAVPDAARMSRACCSASGTGSKGRASPCVRVSRSR